MSTGSASTPSRAMLPVVAMALFIDSLGIGIIIPIAPQLVMEFSGGDVGRCCPHRRMADARLCLDAIRLFTHSRQSQRSLRTKAHPVGIARRIVRRLCFDGSRTNACLAVCRSYHRRHCGRHVCDSQRRRGRSYSACRASQIFWSQWRSLGHGLHRWPSSRWVAGRLWGACTLFLQRPLSRR